MLLALPLLVLVWSLLFLLYYQSSEQVKTDICVEQTIIVNSYAKDAPAMLAPVVSDLFFLANLKSAPQLLKGETSPAISQMGDILLTMSREKKTYDQIRYLNAQGKEVLRVNYNAGAPSLVPEHQLQDKSKRYYFKDVFDLPPGVLFTSPLDLNVENGEIERPFKPMIRFAASIADEEGGKVGVVLINYLGAQLLEKMTLKKSQKQNYKHNELLLMNAEGYYLRRLDREKEWGFMFAEKKNNTLSLESPEVWREVSTQREGQFIRENYLYTFTTIYPVGHAGVTSTGAGEAFSASGRMMAGDEYLWKMMITLPVGALDISPTEFWQFILLAALTGALTFAGAFVLMSFMAQNKKAMDALELRSMQLLTAKEQAESANQVKTNFLANISHEIRTPMNAVMGMTDLLSMTTLDKQQDEYVQMLRDSSLKLLALINDILDFSKIDTKQLTLHAIDFDIHALLQEAKNIYQANANDKGLELRLVLGAGAPQYVHADPRRIQQILFSLLDNALKFTEQGYVEIQIGVQQDRPASSKAIPLSIAVEDSGIGISNELKEHIFDSFFQADGSKTRRYGGTGIGLAITKQLVELMKGSIFVEDVEPHGSRFVFTFDAQPQKESIPQGPGCEEDVVCPAYNELTVLLVDDSSLTLKINQEVLRKIGCEVHVAKDGAEALAMLKMHATDIVFMDLEMPKMDGMEATSRIRAGEAGERNKSIPVIALTAHSVSKPVAVAKAAGADDYALKPLAMKSFKALLDKYAIKDGAVSARRQDHAPVLDRALGLKRMDGDAALYDDILETLKEDLPGKVKFLEEMMTKDEQPAQSAILLSLYDNLSTVGAERSAQIAHAIIKPEHDDAPGSPEEQLKELLRELHALMQEL